jgi:hypothetical protein
MTRIEHFLRNGGGADGYRKGRTAATAPSTAEHEFLEAVRAYQRASGRMFPTWSEVLEVARGLGYEKAAG